MGGHTLVDPAYLVPFTLASMLFASGIRAAPSGTEGCRACTQGCRGHCCCSPPGVRRTDTRSFIPTAQGHLRVLFAISGHYGVCWPGEKGSRQAKILPRGMDAFLLSAGGFHPAEGCWCFPTVTTTYAMPIARRSRACSSPSRRGHINIPQGKEQSQAEARQRQENSSDLPRDQNVILEQKVTGTHRAIATEPGPVEAGTEPARGGGGRCHRSVSSRRVSRTRSTIPSTTSVATYRRWKREHVPTCWRCRCPPGERRRRMWPPGAETRSGRNHRGGA